MCLIAADFWFARRLGNPFCAAIESELDALLPAITIPLPPVTEQDSICEYLEAKLGELSAIVKTIEAQIATLLGLPQVPDPRMRHRPAADHRSRLQRVHGAWLRRRPPELTFQQHIADFLVREHSYGVLEQSDITDTEHCIAEDQLWAFLKATQADTAQEARRTTTAPTRGTKSSGRCARNWSARRCG